ncbi:MAG: orotate phosphoribosyltransferase [Bacteroidia bacterium]|nr:MAG: orotate phosphoribosyltransferase [Bacteroidia bacterium]
MQANNHPAREVAQYLLQINAIKLNVKNPFTWVSGLRAPIYCDNRRILSFPEIRKKVAKGLADLILATYPDVGLVAGVATGAIAHGALVADLLERPFVYVRSTPKAHGLASRVEGHAEPGVKTVVVEDLISTGQSSASAVMALRDAGLEVCGMVAIFTYGLDKADDNLRGISCPFHALSNYEALLDVLVMENKISDQEYNTLKAWSRDPQGWSDRFNQYN